MKHNVKKVQLSRDYDHKRALLKNMSGSLIEYGKIETTVAKAKALRPYIEKLITKAKAGKSITLISYLRKKLITEKSIRKLVEDVAPRFANVNGGYTRIVRTRTRDGDKSEMARIEFVTMKKADDKKNEKKIQNKETKKQIKVKKPSKKAAVETLPEDQNETNK